jgi:hypothetical protein
MEVFDGSLSAGCGPGGRTGVGVTRSPEFSAAGRGCVLGWDCEGACAHRGVRIVSVSPLVGQWWFSNAGGMPPFDLKFQLSGRYLSVAERGDIALFRAGAKGLREIARAMGRDPGTISKELSRNTAVRCGSTGYWASVAQ